MNKLKPGASQIPTPDTVSFPKICFTASGVLWQDKKVLLIEHKKAETWLCPGGHLEPGEIPAQAAEREFFEETGIRVQAISTPARLGHESAQGQGKLLITPISVDLHFVCEENYRLRLTNPQEYSPVAPWVKGCEQHYNEIFLVAPIDSLELREDSSEVTDIRWFSWEDLDHIDLNETVREELKFSFIEMYGEKKVAA